jgi:hypothetical protein
MQVTQPAFKMDAVTYGPPNSSTILCRSEYKHTSKPSFEDDDDDSDDDDDDVDDNDDDCNDDSNNNDLW